jgi:2',3'-cyclic-nucleotide 2'-phosphodiesterase (5'-nucleotidase family)
LVDNFLSKLDYDVLAIGNHELYRYPDALEVALAGPSADYPSDHETGEGFGLWDKENKTRYLTSNVNITLPLEVTGGRKVDRSIGGKYVKFRTLM